MIKALLCAAVLLALSSFGCATTFQGDAYFPGGAPACLSHCASANMEMDSFVYMGEYSTACVCRLKASGAAQSSGGAAAATSGAAVAGIVTQRQRATGASAAAASAY